MRRSVVSNKVAAFSIAILLALVVLTISVVIAATASGTETRSLTSSADTQIVENAPTKNYGATTSLGVNENDQSSIGKDKFALVKWDLSGIAPSTQINSASVTLNVTNSSTETYQAYVLKKPWVESEATWNVYSNGEPWEVAGAKGSLDKEATVAGSITPSVKGKNTLTLPVAVVQDWLDNPDTNQGIIIAYPSSTRGFNFNSREDTDPTQRPQLTLDLIPDTAPPETTIDSGPPGTISSASASFEFSSTEPGSSFECKLDSGTYESCTSPNSLTGLSDGSHTFSVRATDVAGNTDPTEATFTWTVNIMPPETTIDSGPPEKVNIRSANFSFSSNEANSDFECSLDGSVFEPCSSPQSYTDLSEGSHTLEIKAIDQASNTDPTPASRIWTVDTTPPETTIDYGPADGATLSSGDASFTFSSSEAGSTFECTLDGAAFASCTSPKDYTGLSESLHTFEVRATDGAGNVDPTPAVLHYSVEVPPPDTDGDMIPDSLDNCPTVANATQADADGDGTGDACDSQDNRDTDGDGAQNYQDYCPDVVGPPSNNGCPETFPQTRPITITTDGTTLTAPNVRCSGDPKTDSGVTRGILIRASNVTIINPHVENCVRGISIERTTSDTVPSNVRVLGDASKPGYPTSALVHNKESLYVSRVQGGEFGDITPGGLGIDGGRPLVRDTYRIGHLLGSNDFYIHDIDADCGPDVWSANGAPDGGCHWGIKWLADRPTGAPYLVSGNAVKDTIIRGVDEESISTDGRFDVPGRSSIVGTDIVSDVNVTNGTLTLQDGGWGYLGENLLGQYVTVQTGSEQGQYMRITAKSGATFTVADPTDVLAGIDNGERVSIGMAYSRFSFVSNTVYAKPGKVAIDLHGAGVYSEIRDNTLLGHNSYFYRPLYFHFRQLADGNVAPQSIDVKSAAIGAGPAGTTKLAVASHNAVTGNYCEGDVSLNVVTWSQPPAGHNVANYWANNTFAPGAQPVTYLNSPLPSDPLG